MRHNKLYQLPNLVQINFADYVRDLAEHILRSHTNSNNNIYLNSDIAEVELTINTAIPCGLIINELITNALKHAFPDHRSGEIRINFISNEKGQNVLIIQDNGIGIPEELDISKSGFLGMRLVKALTGQLKGSLELDRSYGSTFKLTFPGSE